MITRFTVIGAVIGAAAGFVLQAAMTVIAYLAVPGAPGLFELALQFVLLCILAAAGAAVGSVAGLIVGIIVGVFSRNKE